MKNILVIANLYHSAPRIPALVENLAKQGWKVTIISTPLPDNVHKKLGLSDNFKKYVNLIEVKYSGDTLNYLRVFLKFIGFSINESYLEQIKQKFRITKKISFIDRLLWFYQEIFAYPDAERTWKKPCLRLVSNLLKNENFDLILSSSPYPTSHVIAHQIKKNTGISWVADFRDTWTQNPLYPFSKFRLFFENLYEKKILKNVDNIITVSNEYEKTLKLIHKKDITVIPNGYQGELTSKTTLDKKFSIIYTGLVYLKKQDPIKFFRAIFNLLKQNRIPKEDIVINFYGKKENWIRVLINDYGLNGVVAQNGVIDRRDARKKQETAQILLFFNWEDMLNKGGSSLKMYEYLRAGRPILATGGHHDTEDERVIKETKAGVCRVGVDEIEKYILKAYQEFKNTGEVRYYADQKMLKKHSYVERANILNKILTDLHGEGDEKSG